MKEALLPAVTVDSAFDTLFQNLEEGIVITDEEGRIVLANPRACTLLGSDEEEARGKIFSEVWKQRTFAATLRTIALGSGNRAAIMIFREWKEREVDRARTELLSLAAHQLRTPLTAVKLFTEMLLADAAFTADQRQLLVNIERSNEKMIDQIEHFLSLSVKSEGRLKTRRVPVNLYQFMEHIAAEAMPIAELRGVSIILTRQAPRIGPTDIDPHLLREVIDNLLNNAITYSPRGATVRMHFMETEGGRTVTIADNGIGIPEDAKPHIFKKHYRAANAQSVNEQGNGLGLYMCQIIMESLGGKISFESEAGTGTTFTISF